MISVRVPCSARQAQVGSDRDLLTTTNTDTVFGRSSVLPPGNSCRTVDNGRVQRSDRPEIVRVGREQLLGSFPLTSRGLRLPWRGGPMEYGWLALFLCVGLLIPIFLAVLMSAPLVFPPLAASSLIIATQSQRLNSHPRAVVLSHGCGIAAGLVVVVVFGIAQDGSTLVALTPAHGVAALVAVVLCVVLMALAGVSHAPALATALMIGLGLIYGLRQFLVLMAGVLILTYVLALIHKSARVTYPWWATPEL